MSNIQLSIFKKHLEVSSASSEQVFRLTLESYLQGRDAHLAGKSRRRPSDRSECFDRTIFLLGWDDSAVDNKKAA